jgi:hypothetical protein
MKKLFILLTLIAGLYLLSAQNSVFNTDTNSLTGSVSSSLLNPYKLKMSHSMGFTAGTASNGLGFYESRYTNHLQYEFSPKLNLALDLNFVNYGSTTMSKGFSFEGNDDNKTKILPEFSLNYKPTESISIQLEYRNMGSRYPWLGRSSNWWE